MTGNKRYQYFVEGETEKRLLSELKKEGGLIIPGTINHFNVVEQKLNNSMISNIAFAKSKA